MTYEYACDRCDKRFDIVKPVADMDRIEACPDCQEPGKRQFVPSRLFLSRTSVQHAEYNPGLGCVVRNRQHKEDICKQKGVFEVGNDFKSPDSAVDHFEKGRAEKMAKRWEDD